MCAARVGQVLNLSALANDCGITHNTARAWILVLEASYVLFLLQPHHRTFNKRLIKAPKLLNRGLPSNLFFWRDRAGLEIDVIVERGDSLQPMEIKSGVTVASDFTTGLHRWCNLNNGCAGETPVLFFGGDGNSTHNGVAVRSWRSIAKVAATV